MSPRPRFGGKSAPGAPSTPRPRRFAAPRGALAAWTLAAVLGRAGAHAAPGGPPARRADDDAQSSEAARAARAEAARPTAQGSAAEKPDAATAGTFQPSQEGGDEPAGPGRFRFVFRRYPSLRLRKIARVDFHVRTQVDFRGYEPFVPTQEGTFDLHRTRVGISGNVLKIFEYEIERELRDYFRSLYEDVDEDRVTKNPWRDVYVNVRYFRRAQLQIGKFKIPFGMEQTTGPSKLDFIYRARISDIIGPNRGKGIMAHGRLFERGLNYEFGFFREDGENALRHDDQGSGRHAFAGRVTGRPLRLVPASGPLGELELGLAFVHSELPESQGGLRGRTVSKQTFFDRRFVNGTRLRLGTQLAWSPGRFGLRGEFMHASEQRLGQSIRGEDLPDLVSRGWYVSASWVLTGERKAGGVVPRHDLLRGWGFGATEIAGRYEQIRFGSATHPGAPSRSLRAANILGNSDRAWTFGVNWYLNRWIKIQGNFVRERIEDPQRVPISGQDRYWSRICRLQFEM